MTSSPVRARLFTADNNFQFSFKSEVSREETKIEMIKNFAGSNSFFLRKNEA